jgi:uncharacterized delta-60 repeat protein
MRKSCVFIALFLVVLVPAAAHAQSPLDPTFGVGGRVLVPAQGPFPPVGSESNARLWTASTAEGKLVALAGGEVLQFLSDGTPDPGFGGDGSVGIAVEPGRSFTPAGIAVDSQGRILVAGTSVPPGGTPNRGPEGSSPGPTPTRASVIRYLPNGNVDPSFGNGGIATTDFGIAPPAAGDGAFGRYESAVVTATALTVTSNDQPVVTGTYATMANSCYARRGYAARLDAAGARDQSFGKEGVAYDPMIQQPELLAQAPDGQLLYSGLTLPKPIGPCYGPGPQDINANFADLLPSGEFNPSFGDGGERPHNQALVLALAVDSRGRLVSLEQSYSQSYLESEGKMRVRRLLPNGDPDPAFGRNGSVWPTAAVGLGRRLGFVTLGVDRRNRILLAGGGKTPSGAFGFQLMRLGTKGKVDLGFGRRGRIKTGFGSGAAVKASTLTLDETGKIVLGGPVTGSLKLPAGDGFAFARYRTT